MTLAEQWQAFKEQVTPADAHEIQINAMRMSFYAGLTQMFANNVELGKMNIDNAEIRLISWEQELINFEKEMVEGTELNG